MHYRDSKYNIGLHKIGVKLFGRSFNQPLFEGCGYTGPDREDKVVAQGETRSESTTGSLNRWQGWDWPVQLHNARAL